MRVVIVGGSDAGISAALRARELDAAIEITVVLANAFPNYSICGLPFYLSGETPDWRSLAHRTEFEGINLVTNHFVEKIDPVRKTVTAANKNLQALTLSYDELIIATGARPIEPDIGGLNLPGVYPLHTMEDSFRIFQHLTDRQPRSAVIVGAGYIGLEMADAFAHRGLQVTLVGRAESVLPTVDPDFGRIVENELCNRQVKVFNRTQVEAIEQTESQLKVFGSNGFEQKADLVLIAVGVRPASELAAAAGIELGSQQGVQVDRQMRTNVPHIYAAGDCAQTYHRLLRRNEYLPLGTTAHKQGRIAGENAAGGRCEFAGTLGTQVLKVFDLAIARTGLLEREAKAAGFDAVTRETAVWDHKAYYSGAQQLKVRITGDRQSRRLLGAQIIGHWQSEIAKRIDVFAVALFHEMRVEEISDLDLSYTPPLATPWDAVQVAAQEWTNSLK